MKPHPMWPARPGQPLPPLPLAMRPAMVAKALGLCERKVWHLITTGELRHVRVGRAVLVPTAVAIAWLELKATDTFTSQKATASTDAMSAEKQIAQAVEDADRALGETAALLEQLTEQEGGEAHG
jgi:excisionase family DNA binding protein